MNAETSRVFWFARSSGHLLQWGRVLMNAETIRLTITGPPRTKKLQWGRVLMNAETGWAVLCPHHEEDASMGPRSHERENEKAPCGSEPNGPCFNGGRVLMNAETRELLRIGNLPERFNGAAFS